VRSPPAQARADDLFKDHRMGSARKWADRNRVAIQSFSSDGQVENNHGLERMKRMDADGG
jgi:hypothetical protein